MNVYLPGFLIVTVNDNVIPGWTFLLAFPATLRLCSIVPLLVSANVITPTCALSVAGVNIISFSARRSFVTDGCAVDGIETARVARTAARAAARRNTLPLSLLVRSVT